MHQEHGFNKHTITKQEHIISKQSKNIVQNKPEKQKLKASW